MTPNTVSPALTTVSVVHVPQALTAANMTLRDYFAANAMQGLLLDDNGDFSDRKWLAEESYAFADAMLEARK